MLDLLKIPVILTIILWRFNYIWWPFYAQFITQYTNPTRLSSRLAEQRDSQKICCGIGILTNSSQNFLSLADADSREMGKTAWLGSSPVFSQEKTSTFEQPNFSGKTIATLPFLCLSPYFKSLISKMSNMCSCFD